jgi:hypothetical protein
MSNVSQQPRTFPKKRGVYVDALLGSLGVVNHDGLHIPSQHHRHSDVVLTRLRLHKIDLAKEKKKRQSW